ncbi:conserved hypothetical protein [Ricinus communis]|uniref:Uncharacterized protein n=1 Tax=Ricinus communis TaxID=3988 RepID=B9SG67_RICCO|nr:conserved hypothetical protein [Ricinus communis]
MEAILLVEVEINSLRVLIEAEIAEAKWGRDRYEQLKLIDETMTRAMYHTLLYQQRTARVSDKHVKPRPLKKGNLVLKEGKLVDLDHLGKLRPNSEGP